MHVADLSVRRFSAEGLQKLNLFQTPRFFADVYCLEPEQGQKAHSHEGSDKVYMVLEGRARVRVGDEEQELGPNQAAMAPSGPPQRVPTPRPDRLVLLVFLAPVIS